METTLDAARFPPPEEPTLRNDEVHVWQASLDWPAPHIQAFQDLLAPDELSRAERFRFEKDHQRFIAARGILRTILGRYLGFGPEELSFAYNDHGKPAPIPLSPSGTLNFNLSHATGLLLIALTRDRRIGVDVEYMRPLPDLEQVAERFFADPEKEALQTLPPAKRHEMFFRLWTCKEAYIKARGDGLTLPLEGFHVALIRGQPAPLLCVPGDPREISRWSLRELTSAPDYMAALAVEGTGWRLYHWRYDRHQVFSVKSGFQIYEMSRLQGPLNH